MQFSTIFSVAALVALVAAAPQTQRAQANNCASRANGQSTAVCCITAPNGRESCNVLASIGGACTTAITGAVATTKCCNISQDASQRGLVNINVATCSLL